MKKESGLSYIFLAFLAFTGLGLEVLIGLVIEPVIYGVPINEWSVPQNIFHWIITCILWGLVSALLIRFVSKKYSFDIFQKGNKVKMWQWGLVALFVVISLILSYIDWKGLKVVKEFYANGWLKFIFQYIYYVFETALFTLILIFGQRAFELWFHKPNIPYGGIVLAITWGTAHFFTKDIVTGILSMFAGITFGSVYLLVNRDIRKAFPILLAMFVL